MQSLRPFLPLKNVGKATNAMISYILCLCEVVLYLKKTDFGFLVWTTWPMVIALLWYVADYVQLLKENNIFGK